MAKKTTEAQAPVAPQTTEAAVLEKEVFLLDGDFDDLVILEKERNQVQQQLDQVSGTIFRLEQDQQTLFQMEKGKNGQLEQKRQEITKRYNLDPERPWLIDAQSKRIVYQK